MRAKKITFVATLIIIILIVLPISFRIPLIFRSPEVVYEDFLDTTDQAEDMLMDPLILSGEKMVPLILSKVESPDMPLRRYAIHFLGNGKYRQALPTLESILHNDNEIDYFRGDALASIFNIDSKLGIQLAKIYLSRSDYLGRHAAEIATGKNKYWVQRSYWEALRNVHH